MVVFPSLEPATPGGSCGDYNALSRGTTTRHGCEIMLGSQRRACLGMRQLEEAVLDVLFEAKRNGECPGVVEISRRAGIYSEKGDTRKGESGSVTHSIACGIVLNLFRAGLVRKCPKSPGRSGYEPTELAAVRIRGGVEGSQAVTIPGIAWSRDSTPRAPPAPARATARPRRSARAPR